MLTIILAVVSIWAISLVVFAVKLIRYMLEEYDKDEY